MIDTHPSTVAVRPVSRKGRNRLRVSQLDLTAVIRHRHLVQVRKMHAVHAASLRALVVQPGHSALNKQEPSGAATPEGSTTLRQVMSDGRAASAQCDTGSA